MKNLGIDITALQKTVADRLSGEIFFTIRNAKSEAKFLIRSADSLADRVVQVALDYVGQSYYPQDDWIKYSKKQGVREINRAASYDFFVKLFERDINKKEYKKALCRIICYVENQRSCGYWPERDRVGFTGVDLHDVAPYLDFDAFQKLIYDRNSKIGETHGLYRADKVQIKRPVGVFLFEIFDAGNASQKRTFHEACVRALLNLGDTNDVISIANEYSGSISADDLATYIDKSIDERNLQSAIALNKLLRQTEPNHKDLIQFSSRIDSLEKLITLKNSGSFDPDSISSMTGIEFEQFVATHFERLGFEVQSTSRSGDFGCDLIVITQSGTRISVQCKRFKTKLNLKAVQEVIGSLTHYQCDFGIVITNNSFLNSAVKLAESNDVELWDGSKLMNFVSGDISFSGIRDM